MSCGNSYSLPIRINYMDISCRMVFVQRMEESKYKKESKLKRSRLDDDEFDGRDLPRFRRNFLGQGLSSTPKFNEKMLSNPKFQERGSEILLEGCRKFDRSNEAECLAVSNACFCFGELGYNTSIARKLLEIKRIVIGGPNPILSPVHLVLVKVSKEEYILNYKI